MKRDTFEMGKYIVCFIVVIVGILLIILSFYPFKTPYTWWESWGGSVSNSLGCTLVSAGIISLLLELSSIKKYIDMSIKELLLGEVPYEKYTQQELEKITNQTAKKRIVNQDVNPYETAYKYEKNLIECSNSSYYEYHKSDTILTPDSKKKVFHKQVEVKYCLRNLDSNRYAGELKFKIYSPDEGCSEEEVKNLFVVRELKVNDQKVDVSKLETVIEKINKTTYDPYEYIVTIPLISESGDTYSIESTFEYDVPYKDLTHIYKIAKPCKEFNHAFHMRPDIYGEDSWKIMGIAFNPFFLDENKPDDKFYVTQAVENEVHVVFKDWSLPGSGYVILSQMNNM